MSAEPVRHRIAAAALAALCTFVVRLIASIEIPPVQLVPQRHKGIIIVANHRSLIDLVVGLVVFRYWCIAPYVFVRADLFRIPLVGWLLRSVGGIPAGPGTGSTTLEQGLRILDEGHILVIMPEGRVPPPEDRTDGIGPLRPGVGRLAVPMGTPILLVGLTNTDAAWPLGQATPKFRLSKSRRPHIVVSPEWLPVTKGTTETEVMTAIRNGLEAILRQAGA